MNKVSTEFQPLTQFTFSVFQTNSCEARAQAKSGDKMYMNNYSMSAVGPETNYKRSNHLPPDFAFALSSQGFVGNFEKVNCSYHCVTTTAITSNISNDQPRSVDLSVVVSIRLKNGG